MPESLPTIELYSDIHCPWAYMALYRLRAVWPEYEGRVRVAFRALSLEIKNERPTPKPILDVETVLMELQEPELPIYGWRRPEWQYVPTLLPAFEAEKAAAQQGDEAVWRFSWQVRRAFFAESRTICTRFELAKVADEAGLDVDRFLRDWDSGRFREEVLADTHRGWEELKVNGSPTFVLPSGKQVWNPGAARVSWGPKQNVKDYTPPACPAGDCLQLYRDILDAVVGVPAG